MNYTNEIPNMTSEVCCGTEVRQPTIKDITMELDESVTCALSEAIRLFRDFYGQEDEIDKANPGDFYEAIILIRDKAQHLRRLLAEINNRTGV